jgi:hypothetical protein
VASDAKLERRLSSIEESLDTLTEKVDVLIDTLAGPPTKRNPKERLSEQIRRGMNRRAAAWARAQKKVGQGRGAVNTKKTKRQLERAAKRAFK